MSAGMSTFWALLLWAIPWIIALIIMIRAYESPSQEELERADQVQPD
jgi:hypothetical protein